jgi:hypothetical protein
VSPRPWNWNSFSGELKDAFSNIIHSYTLKTFHLCNIVNVPLGIFLGIVHLRNLQLDRVSPGDFDGAQSSLPVTQAALKRGTTHMVIDHCKWMNFIWDHGTRFSSSTYSLLIWDMEGTEPIFLPFMCRLRSFDAELFASTITDGMHTLSMLIRSLCVSLTLPATLEHLTFHMSFAPHNDNPRFYEDLRDADAWSGLDSIITHPTGSQLHRIDINIDYAFGLQNDDVIKAVLEGLPLLHNKGILFVKSNRIIRMMEGHSTDTAGYVYGIRV